jgi:hypothetical protein
MGGMTTLVERVIDSVKAYVSDAFKSIIPRIEAVEREIAEVKATRLDDVERTVAREIARIPAPKDGTDGRNAFEVAVSLGYEGTVHEWMSSLQGRNGDDGKSVTVDDVRPLIEAAVKAIPIPKDGKDGENGKNVTLDDVRPLIEQAVKAIPAPKDGKDGENGKSVTAEEVLPALTAELQKAIAALPVPKDGRDGIDGKNGTSVTVDDLRAMFEAEQAKWALEWERRAQDQMTRFMDRIPAPKDGKDGADGLGFEDLEVQHDGERTFTVRFVRGEKVKEFAFKIPVLIERGVYRAGQKYDRGDGVTLQGSYWIAQKDTTAKPGESTDWRMAVKKGRDGKDGERGQKGEPGQKGRDGRDYSQTAFPGVR